MTRQNVRQQVGLSAWGWFTTLGTCWALGPLMSDRRYLLAAGVLLGVIVGVGALLRLSGAPRLVVLAAQLVVALELSVLAFTDSWLPDPAAYATLSERLTSFVELAQAYTAPLPRDADSTMAFALMVIGVGVVVDFVGVTLRRVPVLGLLLLLVYMVPVAHMGGDVSLWSFVPGAFGFVFMLAADERERLTHWGRQIRTVNATWQAGEPEVDDTGLRRSRFRIGFGAVAIAAVLPLLLPSVDPRILFDGGSGGDGSGIGDGDVRVDDPSLDLRRNLGEASEEILVRVTGDEPAYFRLAALDEFTGDVWRVGDRDDEEAVSTDEALPNAPGGGSVTALRNLYEVQLTDELDTSWLPVPYSPRSIDVETPWLVDEVNLDVRATDASEADGATYGVSAVIPRPTLVELTASTEPPEEVEPFLELPDREDLPPVFEETLRTATAGAETPIAQALALQSWFRTRGGYRYSLEQVEDDRDRTGLGAVEAFLREGVGYCEQYASAMALMARHLGIPARVAVGFLRPEQDADGVWEYRGQDMHAWPELYFERVGWVTFEPTPPSVSGDAPTFERVRVPTQGPSSDPTAPTTRPTREALEESQSEDDAAAAGSDGGAPWQALLLGLVLLGGLVLLLAAPRLLRQARTRRRWGNAQSPHTIAETAWAELRDAAVDLRLPWSTGTSPRHSGRRLREHLGERATPDVVRALNELVIAIEQSRYARSAGPAADLRGDVDVVRDALAASRSPSTRRLAHWLPASLWKAGASYRRPPQPLGARADSVITLGE
jgi:transglutaminase-like putative cysteine protease